MAAVNSQLYHGEDKIRYVVDQHWFRFKLVGNYTKHRQKQRIRINKWCQDTFGAQAGNIDSLTYEILGTWFYAMALFSIDFDYIFFKNEADAALFTLKFSEEIAESNL